MHLELWAKTNPYHPLWCHLLDTGAVCEQLMNCFSRPMDIPPIWTVYLSALHDIGKADPEFQVMDETQANRFRRLGVSLPSSSGKFRHESRSGRWLFDHLRKSHGWGKHTARVAAEVSRGHHGNFIPRPCADDTIAFDEWDAIRTTLANLVAKTIGLIPFSISTFNDASDTGTRLIGLTVLSDWIASNDELFRYTQLNTNTDPAAYWQQARIEAAHAVDTLRLNSSTIYTNMIPTFKDVWPKIQSLLPSQQIVEKACLDGVPPGLAIIEAPMGEGKTESAIYLSECWRLQHGAKGTYIALPTMATSNQMYHRYSEFLDTCRPGTEPRLVHGMAWLIDDITPQNDSNTYSGDPIGDRQLAREWFSPSKRALIAPESVGTIDQALLAALNVRHGFLRLLGLSSKVLIIDEVHAYDEYMTTILERLLMWCRTLKIPVVMLSATLSKPQKKRLIEAYGGTDIDDGGIYPLITIIPLDRSAPTLLPVAAQGKRTVKVVQHPDTMDDKYLTAQLALDLVRNGGCACILLNTVRQAQDVFKELEQIDPDGKHYLFHARFPAYIRSQIEDQVVSIFGKNAGKNGNTPRPTRAILVATQVVEQSLDLDFDVMISQLAPIDLLLQRVGRLRRHKSTVRPEGLEEALHILLPDLQKHSLGNSKYVYGESVLIRTIAILENRNEFRFPDDFRPLIDDCYGDGCIINSIISEKEQECASIVNKRKKESEADQAVVNLIPKPNVREFSLAETSDAVDESEEGATSYFSASTRLGGNTRSVLMLDDRRLVEAARQMKAPDRRTLKELFRHKVDIPEYWLKDSCPTEGFEAFFEGEQWLRQTVVIPTQSGKWQNSEGFTITCDQIAGIERLK